MSSLYMYSHVNLQFINFVIDFSNNSVSTSELFLVYLHTHRIS